MQSEKGVSGRNSGSLKVKTVVVLVPKDVAHPQSHYNSTRKCTWIGERIVVIESLSREAHLLYHWQVFLTQRNLIYTNRKLDQSTLFLSFIRSFLEGVFYDDVDHALKNLKKPAAYAAKYTLPIIIWWTAFTGGNSIKRCTLGECYITEARKFQTHPRTKAFMFYGTTFTSNDLPLPRLGKLF